MNEGLDWMADQLDNDLYYLADVSTRSLGINLNRDFLKQFDSYDALVTHIVDKVRDQDGPDAANEVADALGNGWASTSEPEISVFKEGNKIIGANFQWTSGVDGDHDYWITLQYDHSTNKFLGGATGGYETDTDAWLNN